MLPLERIGRCLIGLCLPGPCRLQFSSVRINPLASSYLCDPVTTDNFCTCTLTGLQGSQSLLMAYVYVCGNLPEQTNCCPLYPLPVLHVATQGQILAERCVAVGVGFKTSSVTPTRATLSKLGLYVGKYIAGPAVTASKPSKSKSMACRAGGLSKAPFASPFIPRNQP